MNPTKFNQLATQPRRRSAIFIPPKSYERASALLTARHSSKSVQTTQWTRIPGMSSWQFVQVYLANSSVDGKKRFRDEILQFRTIFSAIRRTRCESLTRHVGCARLVRSVLVAWHTVTDQWWFIRCVNLWQKLVNGFLHGCQIWGKSLNDTYLAIPTQYRFDSNPLYSFFILNTIQ